MQTPDLKRFASRMLASIRTDIHARDTGVYGKVNGEESAEGGRQPQHNSSEFKKYAEKACHERHAHSGNQLSRIGREVQATV